MRDALRENEKIDTHRLDLSLIWLMKNFLMIFLTILLAAFAVSAQRGGSAAVKLGDVRVVVGGTLFNEGNYAWSGSKSITRSYYRLDKAKKELVLTLVSSDLDEGKWVVQTIETFYCPIAKIDAAASYVLPMDFEGFEAGKMHRLTLIASGQGADNLNFRKTLQTCTEPKASTQNVNNVTIGFANEAEAAKWLKFFTTLK